MGKSRIPSLADVGIKDYQKVLKEVKKGLAVGLRFCHYLDRVGIPLRLLIDKKNLMHSDEQIEYWLAMMKGITNDNGLSKEQKESDLDDLEEQFKDRLDDSTYNFEDEYIAKVMGKLADLRGLDSLPK